MSVAATVEEDLDELPECPGEGELGAAPPSYVSVDGETWSCATTDGGLGTGDGFGAALAVILLLGLVLSGAALAVKVSMARRMALRSGMDPGEATAMSVLTDDGFEATYLASNLRQQPGPAAEPRTVTQRLHELEQLRNQGLVSEDEYAGRRRRILDEL